MTNQQDSSSYHANCMWVNETGVLILGDAACGKTSLTLAMIVAGRATLVADDQVIIKRMPKFLSARPPAALQGMMQINGVGIVDFDHIEPVPLHLIIELVPSPEVPAIPEKSEREIEGLKLPLLKLAAHETTTADKLWLVTELFQRGKLFNS